MRVWNFSTGEFTDMETSDDLYEILNGEIDSDV